MFYPDPMSDEKIELSLPLYQSSVEAGLPSPATDHIDRFLDLNEHLIEKPAATFFARVSGDSMKDAGIHHGDLIIVDRSKTPVNNAIVLAIVNGEFTVKRLSKRGDQIQLCPENKNYQALTIKEGLDFEVWGVVIHSIHSL
jgi:DNA polymerase V